MTALDFIGIYMLFAGFVVGLGSVTVIDLHGFLARKSRYWTKATTQTHKVTKPLIWIGIILAVVGAIVSYRSYPFSSVIASQAIIAFILILNGLFLSFGVSPFLIQREKENKSGELLPKNWQTKITLSFIVSFLGWWIGLGLVIYTLFYANLSAVL